MKHRLFRLLIGFLVALFLIACIPQQNFTADRYVFEDGIPQPRTDGVSADFDALKKKFVHAMNGNLGLNKERTQVEKLYKSINELALKIDITLEDHIQAQYTKHQQCLDRIETKLVKAEKRNREDEMRMINDLKEYAFPGGTLQERKVNYLSITNDNFIDELLSLIEPFDLRMHILLE